MYTKILLVIIIIILSAFFYLHTQNPGAVTFVITREHTYVMPVTLLVFAGFFAGVIVAVVNSVLVDAKRAIREMREKRDKRLLAQAEENYRKGMDALVKGETAEAREYIEKSLKARPSDTGKIISLSETYTRENKPREALKVLETGLLNNSNSIGILMAIHRCSSDIDDSFRAAKALEEVIKIDPKHPYALSKLRDFRVRERNWAEAAKLQKTLVENERDEDQIKKERRLLTGLLFESAKRHVEEGRLNDAVARVKEVLKNDDAFMPAHILLGEALRRQGNVSSAVKVWEKAHLKYPNSEPILLKLEDLFIMESAPDRILEKYKREISSHPDDPNLKLLLSRLYLRLEMVDNAIEELERLHQEGEDSFYPQVLLAEAYLRRKQGGKAAHHFHMALGLDREFLPPFICTNCRSNVKTWEPRCPSCGEWNTLLMESSSAAAKLPIAKTGP